MRTTFLLLILLFCLFQSQAQDTHFRDSAQVLNKLRIKTNKNGMYVLADWGGANIGAGVAGYLTEGNNQWKYFYGMNAIWGVVNASIGIAGLAGADRELHAQLDGAGMLQKYESTKRLYLINAGLDVLYIGTGVYLTEHSRVAKSGADEMRGFGKSFIMQGAFLLVFDNVMFASHQRRNGAWYRLLRGTCVTGNGIGFNYKF